MKRHPALQDLSRDHFTALLRALHVRRAVTGDDRAPPLADAAAAFLHLWRSELAWHFQEEEETTIVPELSDRGGAALRDRLLQEHERLRAGFGALAATSDPAAFPGLDALADDLTRHARWEEDEVFPWVQDTLDDAALQALAQASRAFRLRHRGPEAVGPSRPLS